jgi:hypothetical protein
MRQPHARGGARPAAPSIAPGQLRAAGTQDDGQSRLLDRVGAAAAGGARVADADAWRQACSPRRRPPRPAPQAAALEAFVSGQRRRTHQSTAKSDWLDACQSLRQEE